MQVVRPSIEFAIDSIEILVKVSSDVGLNTCNNIRLLLNSLVQKHVCWIFRKFELHLYQENSLHIDPALVKEESKRLVIKSRITIYALQEGFHGVIPV